MYQLPKTLTEDILRFGVLSEEYRKKKIEPILFKAFRVPMGIYEQRKDEVYMSRIRTTGGVIYPKQFLGLIKIALQHHSDLLHITTRQEIQIQNLQLEEISSILSELQEIGLATKGGGGNTIRNILVSCNSGISKDEIFDTTPYAMALTSKLIAEMDSYLLPRKMKIAFSSDDKQIDYAAINDLGFVAKIRDGKKGFQVYVGGGGGSKPSVGWLLFDFIPENELFIIAEAVKKMFSEQGNRKNKHKARIRYIFYRLGTEETISLIKKYYEEEKKTTALFVPTERENSFATYIQSDHLIQEKEYEIWKRRYVSEQKQIGYVSILVPFEWGNIPLDNKKLVKSLQDLFKFVSQFGEDTVRFTTTQNVQLRNIPNGALPELYFLIKEIVSEVEIPLLINNIVSCTGADTCRLGICLSKGLATAVRNKLRSTLLDWDQLANACIHISGCPNSCGQQLWADIGFSGKVLRNDRIYPGYQVYLAADRRECPKLAESIGSIAARDIPDYVVRLLNSYLENRSKGQYLADYLQKEGREQSVRILNEYQKIPSFEEDKSYYFDWGEKNPFNVIKRGSAECSSGLFDMIEVDLKYIQEAKKALETETDKQKIHKYLYDIVYSSSRMLLVTRGVEPKTAKEVFHLFLQYFLDKGLVKDSYRSLIEKVEKNELLDLTLWKEKIYSLSDAVTELYRNMDDSLQFKNIQPIVEVKEALQGKRFKDLRGLVCPMNFVQTKIQLAQMQSGEELEIWLDDGHPVHNVPASIQNEGHQILAQIPIENYWKVIIKKK